LTGNTDGNCIGQMVPLGKKRFYLYIISMVKHTVSLRDKDSDKCIASVYLMVLPWGGRENSNNKKNPYIQNLCVFTAGSLQCIASVYLMVLPWGGRENSNKIPYINPATKFGAPVLPQGIFDAIYRYIL
jgi:hypothetical protein